MKKYTIIRNKYLAEGLSFCNFKYQKYQDKTNKTVYSFEETEKLKEAINIITKIKKNNQ